MASAESLTRLVGGGEFISAMDRSAGLRRPHEAGPWPAPTIRRFAFGRAAEGKDSVETQTILNHKQAIEMPIEDSEPDSTVIRRLAEPTSTPTI